MGNFNLNSLQRYYTIIPLLLSIVLFPLAIGTVHLFDWDEVNFAEISREMILSGNYWNVQINFQPFWEKPPLFFWLQALSMHVFGINEFAARFPNVLVGIVSIWSLLYIGKKKVSAQFAFIWAMAYLGSFLPHFYFKSGIIDPLFNLLIFWSLVFFYQYQESYSKKDVLFTAIFAGLAVLTKGPVAILIIGLVVFIYIIYTFKTFKLKILDWIIALFAVILISSVWFISEILNGGGVALFREFLEYQIRLFSTSEAGHGQPFYYHFVVLFFGCFPISLIAFPFILKKQIKQEKPISVHFYTLNFILFWVVLLLFSITTTKIVHYTSLTYFPLSYIAATILYEAIFSKKALSKVSYLLILIVGIVVSILFILLPLVVVFKDKIIPFIKDKFAVANILLPVHWSGYEFLIGVLYLILFLIIAFKIRKNIQNVLYLFFLNAILLNMLMIFIVPKIEQHSQGALISFLQKHQNKDAYFLTYGFKSYAQYYYANKQIPINVLSASEDWLLTKKTDKPVYVICKIQDKEKTATLSEIKYLYEKGGFAFFIRNK